MKKLILLFVCSLLLVVSGAKAQSSQPVPWTTFLIKGEDFSFSLPRYPFLRTEKVRDGQKDRKRHTLTCPDSGVQYTIYIVENSKRRQTLEEFIKEQTTSNPKWELKSGQNLTLDRFTGKTFVYSDDKGMVHFYATEDRLYDFRAYGAPVDDARMTRFFSSISLAKPKFGVEVFEGPGQAFASADFVDRMYKGSEVDRKVQLKAKPTPSYDDIAKQNMITGTVVLKCVFSAQGTITNIRVVSGLPYGLTERAIAAARRIKFIPAMKNGRYVSMWMQLEYNFNLY